MFAELLKEEAVQQMLQKKQCCWAFTAPRAPWQNGIMERLIGLVKSCLKRTLHRTKVSLDELTTLITETSVSKRSLTYQDVEVKALTSPVGRRTDGSRKPIWS